MPYLELQDLFQSGEAARLAASPLSRIDRLAGEIARTSPESRAAADEIRAAVHELRAGGPSPDEIVEAIERVCGDELSGVCAARIADAVSRTLRGR